MKKYKYITTAIDYVNNLPHIGTAYEKIGADVMARFARMQGYDVRFQMGNDEHSANVQKSAIKQGLDPKVYCDQMRPQFEDVWQRLSISYDKFVQTTEPFHHAAVKKLFQKIFDAGDIYPRDYEGWYCESCEAFYTEKDLVEGQCPNHKAKPQWLKEQNYFFKLSKFADFLIETIEKNPHFILPEKRRNEVLQFIKRGLEDVSVSRSSFNWGIPLPIKEDHVVYVWFDALINYISGLNFADDESYFNEAWQNVTHVVGKDITRFHCVIWPAMLQSAGVALPKTIFGHGFVNLKGEKMSKSLGNVVTPLDVLNEYPDFGADALRYYLLRGSSFGNDGDFTWESFIERYNADLANGFGNLVSRTLGMVWRYQDGKIETLNESHKAETALLQDASVVFDQVALDLDPEYQGDINFHLALEKIWAYLTKIDQYIDQKAPWTLAKEKKTDELSVVLTSVCEAIRLIAALVYPVIPQSAAKVWSAFGDNDVSDLQNESSFIFKNLPHFKQNFQFRDQKIMLFPRIVDDKKKSEGTVKKMESHPEKVNEEGLIDIADFSKLDLRIAQVISAARVEGADKLLVLQVDLGGKQRQIVAGIAEHYAPEAMIGKSVVIVSNLKPATIRGVESFGMLLAAKKGKKLCLVTPEVEIASNAKVG